MEAPSASSSSVPQAVINNTATAPFGSLQQDLYMPMTPVSMEPVLMEPMFTPTINDHHQDEKQANDHVGRRDVEEHRRFLLGLKRYGHGHGNWQKIATLVGTRTPFQVTSHAMKFYKRQKLPLEKRMNKKRSIHDIIDIDMI
ncbi:hypothetical protein Droror1_Dr00018432 [Drosera rotundifolia]